MSKEYKDYANPQDWPEVPEEDRPKRLPHEGTVRPEEIADFEAKGWHPVDIRLLPNVTDEDRVDRLHAMWEGMHFGTVAVRQGRLRAMELEARALGLLTGKQRARQPKKTLKEETLDKMLSVDYSPYYRKSSPEN